MKNLFPRKNAASYLGLLSSVLYLIGWSGAILLAFLKLPQAATLPPLICLLILFVYTSFSDRFIAAVDIFYALLNLFLGLCLEFLLINLKSISYKEGGGIICPLWVLTLYPLFSLFIHHHFLILKKNLISGFFVGAFGGAYLYYGCQKLGLVVALSYPKAGLLWGLYFLIALYLSLDCKKAYDKVNSDRYKNSLFTILYDGGCRICDKEISCLKKGREEKVRFIDISSCDYNAYDYRGITYEIAMKLIHGFFEDGPIVQGTQALSPLYSKTGKHFRAFILNLAFLKPLTVMGYKLFARIRYIFQKKRR